MERREPRQLGRDREALMPDADTDPVPIRHQVAQRAEAVGTGRTPRFRKTDATI